MEQVEDAIEHSNANIGGDVLMLGSQAHNVRAIGLLGKGIDPLDPNKVSQSFELETKKIDDINRVVITSRNGEPIYVKQVAKAIVGHRPRLGIVGQGARPGRRDRGHRPDEEGRAVAPDGRAGPGEVRRDRAREAPARGDEDPGLQPADRPRPRHDPQRAAQPGRGHGAGRRRALRVPGRPGQRGDRGDHDPPGAPVLGHGPLRPARVGQPAVDRCGRFRHHRRQLGDHRREHLPPRHGPRRRPQPLADRPDHRGLQRDRAGPLLLDDDHHLRLHPALLHDRAGGRPVRPHGQHLRLRDRRRALPGPDPRPGALLVPVREQDRGGRDDRRPDHEAAVPADAQPGAQLPLPDPGGDAGPADRHGGADPDAGGRVHAPARGGQPLDPRRHAAHRLAGRRRADGPATPRGHRLDPRGPGGHVAGRPARRRHRRDQLSSTSNSTCPLKPMEQWRPGGHPREDPGRAGARSSRRSPG